MSERRSPRDKKHKAKMPYKKALRICEQVAQEEFNYSIEALDRTTRLVEDIRADLKRKADKPHWENNKASKAHLLAQKRAFSRPRPLRP